MNFSCLLAGIVLVLLSSARLSAQTPSYEGKVIRIIVGSAAGGGFDTYSRVIARHLPKQLPGNPTIIVENMTGAGGLIAANYVYKVAKPDGLTIGNIVGTFLLGQLLERQGIEFDARRFEYIGVPVKVTYVCGFTRASGITNLEKWKAAKSPVKIGSTVSGANLHDVPQILKAALGLPLQVISGYKSIADIRLAAEGGEVDGICGVGWETLKAIWANALKEGNVSVVLQMRSSPHPELPKVPLAIDLAKNDEVRELIKVGTHDTGEFLQPYVLPPGTPKEHLSIHRRAFQNTMKNSEFLADANKSKLNIEPGTGEAIEEIVAGLFKRSPRTVARLKEILK